MKVSKSASELKKIIIKAIEDHKLTYEEYEDIIHLATADGHVDPQEKALLAQLMEMIDNRMVRIRKKSR